jgi:hypothetical protein
LTLARQTDTIVIAIHPAATEIRPTPGALTKRSGLPGALMEKLVLVHLSDIHFTGSSGLSVHDLDAEVRNELLRDAAERTKELGGATGVLVTGDIAFSGQRAEYDQAGAWLQEFCRAIGCADENVWVVAGNHDVDRKIAKRKVTKTIHESIRSKRGTGIDDELREILSDRQSANALLDPLGEYNAFAARYQCSVSAERPYWERDLVLACGTIIRLRGLCRCAGLEPGRCKGQHRPRVGAGWRPPRHRC